MCHLFEWKGNYATDTVLQAQRSSRFKDKYCMKQHKYEEPWALYCCYIIFSTTWGEQNAASQHALSFLNNFVVGDKVACPSLKR